MRNRTTRVSLISLVAAAGTAIAEPPEPPACAQRAPVRVGEDVAYNLDSSHPYGGAVAARLYRAGRWQISDPGATYIAPHFSRFELALGDYLIVRSPDGSRSWRYEGYGKGDLGRLGNGGFWGIHVRGDTAIIELMTRGGGEAFGFTIDRYARGLANFPAAWPGKGPAAARPGEGPQEALCGADDTEEATCYTGSEPTVYDEARAVARLLIQGSSLCTGWLVGDQGHLMTNEHCIGSSTAALNTDYEFMAEGASCAQDCRIQLGCGGTIEATSATLIQLDAGLDYAFVQLPVNITPTYGFMQLRATGAVLEERIYMPQHPAGWGKRIGVLSSHPQNPTGFGEVDGLSEPTCSGGGVEVGYYLDTQGGSSGSPVLAHSDHLVVALHHCRGAALSCGDPNRGVPIQNIIADLGPNLPASALPSAGGGFLLAATPASLDSCVPSDAVYTIDVTDNGSADPVTLSATGAPAGTTVGFSPNPVSPTGQSTMTISNTGAAAAGAYTIDIDGTSASDAQSTSVDLAIAATPAGVSLSIPADAASDVSVTPTLTWAAVADATDYLVEVATDATFTTIVASASVTGASYSVSPPLAALTQHYWRVTGSNGICGSGPSSSTYSFTTELPAIQFHMNSGGASYTDGAGTIFAADTAYTIGSFGHAGGAAHSFTSPTFADILGTTDDLLYQDIRYDASSFSYLYDNVPAGDYDVTFYWFEPNQGLGGRVFDVTIEGALVLDDYDIFAEVGAAVTAHQEVVTVTVGDGQLNIDFAAVTNTVFVCAISVVSSGPVVTEPDISVSPLSLDYGQVMVATTLDLTTTISNSGAAALNVTGLAPTDAAFTVVSPAPPFSVAAGADQVVTVRYSPALVQVDSGDLDITSDDPDEPLVTVSLTGEGVTTPALEFHVNCGGATYAASTGITYDADQAYAPGSWGHIGGSPHTFTAYPQILGTVDDLLYQEIRFGPATFSYQFDNLPTGSYDLTFHWFEPNQTLGGRVMDVSIEGSVVLADFDIFAAVGAVETAHQETVTVSVSDGELNIDFDQVTNTVFVGAISVVQQ